MEWFSFLNILIQYRKGGCLTMLLSKYVIYVEENEIEGALQMAWLFVDPQFVIGCL